MIPTNLSPSTGDKMKRKTKTKNRIARASTRKTVGGGDLRGKGYTQAFPQLWITQQLIVSKEIKQETPDARVQKTSRDLQ